MALSEAAAYGLPAIVNDTGGWGDVVFNGKTGSLLPPSAGPEAYAAPILEFVSDPGKHAEMRRNSRRRFDTTLNWDAWAKTVGAVAQALA